MLNGGVESVIMNYYRNINRDSIRFDFLCNTQEVTYEDEIRKLGGNIFKITARSKAYNKYREDMREFFSQNAKNYDAIWVNLSSLANIDYLKYAKKYGIKHRIIHCHNSKNTDSFARGLLHEFNKLFLKKYATDFWTCSHEASKWFYGKKIIKSNNYRIIRNAIDTEKFIFNNEVRDKYRKELEIKDNLVIGHIGRFHFQKNHPFIIKIFNEIYKQRKNAILLLIGSGKEEEKIKQMVKDYNLEKCVKFLGNRDDIPEMMQAMDVFLFPSLFEGLPLVLVEAQASGLKIYTSAKNISREVIIDKDNINFISLNAHETVWATKIINDINTKEERKSKENLVQEANYDIKREAKKLEKILNDLCTGEKKYIFKIKCRSNIK